ncbi:MAG: hypothetical protein LAO55_16955 [Acidobacteriia bacterium]|nr:hypothetical protein [Terriglobia bacterium]
MRGFAQRDTMDAALAWLDAQDAQLQPLAAEIISLRNAARRVLAASVVSDVDVPGFDRATMDGYALVADSTEVATAYTPLSLTVIDDSMRGSPFGGSVFPGEAVRVMTGGPMLSALVERDGGIVDFPGLVRDDPSAILEALQADADIVIVSGGSSVGIEDLAPVLVAQHGELAVQGIIRALGGRPIGWPYRAIRGRLNRKISSPIGRLDYVRVKIDGDLVEPLAVGGASVLSSTTRANGFVIVGDDSEGFAAGSDVTVWRYA